MYRKFIIYSALIVSVVSFNAQADTSKKVKPENGVGAPPAQIQKDQLPDDTSTGNYLEPQPDENGAVNNPNCKGDVKNKLCEESGTSQSKKLDKSLRTREAPEDGGMDLENK